MKGAQRKESKGQELKISHPASLLFAVVVSAWLSNCVFLVEEGLRIASPTDPFWARHSRQRVMFLESELRRHHSRPAKLILWENECYRDLKVHRIKVL